MTPDQLNAERTFERSFREALQRYNRPPVYTARSSISISLDNGLVSFSSGGNIAQISIDPSRFAGAPPELRETWLLIDAARLLNRSVPTEIDDPFLYFPPEERRLHFGSDLETAMRFSLFTYEQEGLRTQTEHVTLPEVAVKGDRVASSETDDVCVFCMHHVARLSFDACMHKSVCLTCKPAVLKSQKNCPVCRKGFKKLVSAKKRTAPKSPKGKNKRVKKS